MKDKAFLDTNILVYCYTDTEPEKREKARVVASHTNVVISTQVLKEFINTLFKKFKLEWTDIRMAVKEVKQNFPVYVNSEQTIDKACSIAERYGFSFYDSLIIAAAFEAECTTLYSEDLQDQQKIEGRLVIINPFKGIVK